MSNELTKTPDGYMVDAMGRLVPETLVGGLDKLRTQLCRDTAAEAHRVQEVLRAFKSKIYEDVRTLLSLAAEQYNVTIGGEAGNISLTSYDGLLKIQVQINKQLAFGEQIHVAKQLIDQCVQEWTVGTRAEVQALIQDAFRVDDKGDLSAAKILSLRRLNIQDARWRQAMQAIADSIMVAGSKSYVRVYERDNPKAAWRAITLDLAAL
jgi:coenzyme F420-reducing hydrogenase delta subunit